MTKLRMILKRTVVPSTLNHEDFIVESSYFLPRSYLLIGSYYNFQMRQYQAIKLNADQIYA